MDKNIAQKAIDSLMQDRVGCVSEIEHTKKGIQFWYEEREAYRKQLYDMIEDFNYIVSQYKNAKNNVALGQHRLHKHYENLDEIDHLIEMLENLS